MGNLRPFMLFNAALLKSLKYAFFIEKSTKSVEKACILALDITFSKNLALKPIWVAHGWLNRISDKF
jgi:hypothetical protein